MLEKTPTKLSKILKEERHRRGLTQVMASIGMGISLSTLQLLEQGAKPTEKTLEKLEKWLGKNLSL